MDPNVNQEPAGAPPTSVPPPEAPAEYVVPEEGVPSGPPIKKIISLVVGVVVILLIIISLLVFVLPKFRSKKVEDATLKYWVAYEDAAAFQEVAQEFTRQNPHIKIVIEKQDIKGLGKYVDRLATRIGSGTGPDIFRYHNSWIYELKYLLLALPQDVVKKTELDTNFYSVVKDDLKIGGAYYGVPIHFDTLALFVNTDLLKAAGISAPTTWDDLTSAARKLTTIEEEGNKIVKAGVALGTYDNVEHASDILSLLLLQNGAKLTNLKGANKSDYQALEFYTDFAKGENKVWDETLENSKLAFARGNVAMYFGYSWDIFEIKAINPNLAFTIVHAPDLQGIKATIASYWVEGVSNKTRYPQQAFEFLKFLGSRSTMEKLYSLESKTRAFGELYPRVDMAELLSSNELIYPFVAQGENAKSTIFSSDTHDEAMVDALNAYMGDAIRSVINDNKSPESAMDTLGQGVAQKLADYAE
ncbi:MAG: hypothetical protein A2776_01445 [Candidatus Levybacteria bacterium RIFCSPHIGHO2_01_FULL_40_10]|nr:MAG: hypothetical protein A2776_01445 [Candidatus Levybacteria bacterium RIFCSPHIGHO2_01_FULL_40_10]